MRAYAILPILISAPLAPLQAQQFEDIVALDRQIAVATGVNIGESGGAVAPIDRRLKLGRCPDPVTIEPPQMGSLAVRCPALGWRIRVPVVQSARSSSMNTSQEQSEILVKRGEAVELIMDGDGFEVSTNAIAMDDGFFGKAIRVKTLTNNNSTIATVKKRGTVYMPH